MKKLVILDRDGVINYDSAEYIKTIAEWRPLPGSLAAIALLKQKGVVVAIATNQSGLGRGYFSQATLDAIHAKLLAQVHAHGGEVAHICYCPHAPEAKCKCRKPLPGLIQEILIRERIDLNVDKVFVVGDSMRDLEAAIAANCQPILVKTGNGERTLAKIAELNANGQKKFAAAVYTDLLHFAEEIS